MERMLRIGFIGYADIVREYLRAFEKIENISFEGAYWGTDAAVPDDYEGPVFSSPIDLYESVDAVIFLGEKIRKKLIADAIRSLKHVFIDDYSAVLNGDIESLYNLAKEAEIVAQVSMPKMHYWNISDIIESTKNIRHIFFCKEQSHLNNRFQNDYIPEIAAILKLIDDDALRIYSYKTPLLSKKVEMVDIRVEFANGVSAGINSNPCGFYDAQELRIISEKALVMFDLRKREVHALVKSSSKELEKEVTSMEEIPFVEIDELKDFTEAIEAKKDPMLSFGDIKRLHRCLQMMEER
ncbi:MAG: hypothetical protein LBG19_03510 [Prevotellaceae bacterium]|jgi:predicted dehydrogenase|nr:hypothetical protein [Prevotellaceae bacterium]